MAETEEVLLNSHERDADIVTYRRRWVILGLFMLYGMANQAQYVVYVTVVEQSKDYFGVDAFTMNLLPAIYAALYVTLVFPGCKIYGKLGLKTGMVIGSGLNLAGAAVRLCATLFLPQFWLLVVSHILAGLAQIFFLGLPPLIASVWFPVEERALATAFGVLTGFIGLAAQMFASPKILEAYGCHEHSAVKHGPPECTHGFNAISVVDVGLCLLPFIGIVLFIKNAPPTPPSRTANTAGSNDLNVMAILKRLVKNFHFMVASQIFGIVIGTFTAVATVLPQILKAFGFSESQSAVLGFAGIMSGAFCCALVSPVIDKFRRYKLPWIVMNVVLTTLLLIFLFGLSTLNDFIVLGHVCVIGLEMFVLAQFPVALDLSIELSYPEDESISGSFMMLSLSFWQVIATVVFSIILGDDPNASQSKTALWLILGLVIVSLGVLIVVQKEIRLRWEAEQSQVEPRSTVSQNNQCVA